MDTTQPPSAKQLVIWNIIIVIFIAAIGYMTQPPCDKPVAMKQWTHPKKDIKAEATAAVSSAPSANWNTDQGDTVNYLFKPAASFCTLILLVEAEVNDSQAKQQMLEIKLSGNNSLLPDPEAIKPLMKLLGSQYTLSKLHIQIEGAIEEQIARDMAEREQHRPSLNAIRHKPNIGK